ncbi:MAG: ATP-binding cassette domain-containing protein [Firmicutes bacterium]|nr:ATP-binding cassette domain-containing protein [Bacillota bacterium]
MFNSDRLNMKKKQDDALYDEAFGELLSVLGVSGLKGANQAKMAIVDILNYLGENIPTIPGNITEFKSQIEYILRPSGTMKRRIELVGEWWKDSSGCILASKKNGEIVAILPNKWSGYHYVNEFGKSIKINAKTSSEFEMDAFCFYKSFPQRSLKIKDLAKFMMKNISLLDATFVLSVYSVMQLLGMIAPYITNIIYNILIPSGSISLLVTVAGTFLGLTVGTSLIGLTQTIVKTRLQGKLNLSVNSAIMMRLFNLPANFFKKYSSGELASRINYVASLCQIISDTVLSTFLTAFFSIGYILQMLQQAPEMVLPGMLVILVSLCFSVFITFSKQALTQKKIDLAPKLQSLVFGIFGGIQKIKISGAEKRAFAIWAKNYSKVQKLEYSPPFLIKISSVINMVITSLGTIFLYWVASKNRITIANYMSFHVAYGAVSGAIMSLCLTALQIASLKPILNLIKPFLVSELENSSDGKIITSISGDIEMNDVVFRYKKNSEPILKNFNLRIKKGEYVAIVGKTGCGKSTIMRLLLGFESPEQGGIYYDKCDIASLDKRSLRQRIGVVMQNGAIFSGDIFSNITVTSPGKNMKEAWEAAHLAAFGEDIKNMPMGMHTLISEGAGGISSGQKQRIMIARALIQKPEVLFFDEATSALDNITQKEVSDNIKRLKCTRISIAHRLSTVKNCDRILVLEGGKIAEEGNFQELMEKKGKFYELASRQIA